MSCIRYRQIWGHTYSSIVESVHNNICKRHLTLSKTINNDVALGECGRLPLCVSYFTICIRYWCKLLHMSDDRYPKNCYKMLKRLDEVERKCWATHVKQLLFKYGFGFVWVSQDVGDINLFVNAFRQRIIDCKTQEWHDSIQSSSRCQHYKFFKSILNIERYLTIEMPSKLRIAYSKFRCSNHKFNIEIGRHTGIPRDSRFCNHCLRNSGISVVECEFHVFFECSKYDLIRQEYLYKWYTKVANLNNFYLLLSSTEETVMRKLANFIFQIMKIS